MENKIHPAVISVENLSKAYRLGQIGTGTLRDDLKVWAARLRGKPNPLLKIGQADQGNRAGEIIWALRDISFQVEQGEVLGIIGRNGAGKSTLLKILSRVTAPTSGQVRVRGRIASLLEVGTGFHPDLTGRENIYLNGAILGMTKDEVARKFAEMVDFSGVEQFIDTPVKRYSSGMYVRLAFAVAAHLEAEILLVDEVLAVGDAEFQQKCLRKMGDVASREGRTVLFVSHNMAAISRLCQSAILLRSGKIQDSGDSHHIVESYLMDAAQKSAQVTMPPAPEKFMCLREVKILDEAGKPATTIAMGTSLLISVRYDINRPVKSSHVICMINTVDGVNILSTGDTDTNPARLGNRFTGTYEAKIKIPPSLLGEGQYTLTFSIGVPFVQVYDRHENIVGFEINDHQNKRSTWQHHRRPGILALEIPWDYEREPVGNI